MSTRFIGRMLGAVGAATIAVGMLPPVAAHADVVCGQDITVSTTLTHDMTCPGTALFVTGSGVTLDLGGHTLTGPAPVEASGKVGVMVTDNRANDTVRNGNIRAFDFGVDVHAGAVNTTVTGLNISGSTLGIRTVTGSSASHLVGNVVTGTLGNAIQLGGDNNVVEGDTLTSAGGTGVLFSGNNDTIDGNVVTDAGAPGISLIAFPSTAPPFVDNRIVANTVRGAGRLFNSSSISLTSGSGTVVQGNTVTGRLSTPGVFVNDSANTTVYGNTLTQNAPGVLVRGTGSTGTQILSNTATANQNGIVVEAGPTATSVTGNSASSNRIDGIHVSSPATVVTANTANYNGNWGIFAVSGTVDGGGNRATGNGQPAQCTPNIACSPA